MSTKILAARHAQAKGGAFADDFLRPLSDEGRKVQKQMAELLKGEGWKLDQIWSSPLLRARESAEVIASVFGLKEVLEQPALGDAFDAEALLASFPKEQTLLLVGHAPSLAAFVKALTREARALDHLETSEVAVLEFPGEIAFGEADLVARYKPPDLGR